jgi:hypothetical protein
MNPRALMFPLALLALTSACTPPAEDGGDEGDDEGVGDKGIQTEDQGDGSYVSVVDARDEAAFTYLDFEAKAAVDGAGEAWDLGFLRFNVATHVEVAVLEGVRFEDVAQAPADGYVVDASDPETAMQETMPGYAFDLWYDYDPTTHALSARDDVVYVVHTPEGNYFKVQMLDYYDEAGTSGYVSLRWAPVPAPT